MKVVDNIITEQLASHLLDCFRGEEWERRRYSIGRNAQTTITNLLHGEDLAGVFEGNMLLGIEWYFFHTSILKQAHGQVSELVMCRAYIDDRVGFRRHDLCGAHCMNEEGKRSWD